MRKYQCITFIAVFAIVCLQSDYLIRLYNDYRAKNIIQCKESLRISLDQELHLRRHMRNKLCVRFMKDMTSQEKDSLLKITRPGDTIDIDHAREIGVGTTIGDIYFQIAQDNQMRYGTTLNMRTTDSLYTALSPNDFPHCFLLYDKDKQLIDSIGHVKETPFVYSSDLLPLGTKSLQYMQIKVHISVSDFIEQQFLTLILSVCLMLIAMSCLIFQLTEIKRKNKLLFKREASVNGIIHDLKTPLNGVITMLSWLKMMEQNPEKKELLQCNQSGVKNLVCQIESLLISARRNRQKIILNKTQIDIYLLTEKIRRELSLLYKEKPHSIAIVNDLPKDFCIFADAMYLENVIRNLIENSLKYSDDDVLITINLQIGIGGLRVCIKDNGWGIERKYQKKIFTQFYQVPRSQERIRRGYGIGLVHAKYIIDEHGGAIKVVSIENKGSAFTFTLPLK